MQISRNAPKGASARDNLLVLMRQVKQSWKGENEMLIPHVTPHTVVYRACNSLEMIYRLDDYSVSNHKDKSRPFKISKHYPWYTTDACFVNWLSIPEFDSFIQACIWLKKHHTELL